MRKTTACAALGALVGLAGIAPAQIAQPEQVEAIPSRPAVFLFADDPAIAPPASIPTEMIQVKSVVLDEAALSRLGVGDSAILSPENLAEEWIVDSISNPSPDTRIVRLRHATEPTGYCAFLTYQDATAMTLHLPSRKQAYRLHFVGGGQYHIWRVNRDALAMEGRPLQVGEEPVRITPPDFDPTLGGGYDDRDAGACGGTSRVLDIMIVYTAESRDAAGGTTAIRAEAALAVDHFNTAAIGSSMSTRMRLVYCNLVTYTEAGDHDIDLPRLRSTDDGFMDDVHTTRSSVNADMVELILNSGSGLGYCPGGAPTYSGSPFNTGAWWRIAATFTTAHECGHNLGGGHNVADGGACGPSYGVGWRWTGNDSNGYCSVIAYPTGFYERILRYSNPNINYQGVPTGIPAGQPNEAFNVQVLINNDNTVEAFEFTRYDVYVDFAYGGAENGTASQPYDTVAEGVTNIDTPNTGAGELPTLYIDAGTQTYQATISKAMTIIPCGGPVTIQ